MTTINIPPARVLTYDPAPPHTYNCIADGPAPLPSHSHHPPIHPHSPNTGQAIINTTPAGCELNNPFKHIGSECGRSPCPSVAQSGYTTFDTTATRVRDTVCIQCTPPQHPYPHRVRMHIKFAPSWVWCRLSPTLAGRGCVGGGGEGVGCGVVEGVRCGYGCWGGVH